MRGRETGVWEVFEEGYSGELSGLVLSAELLSSSGTESDSDPASYFDDQSSISILNRM